MMSVDKACEITGFTRKELGAKLGAAERTVYTWGGQLPETAYYQLYGMFKLGLLPKGVKIPDLVNEERKKAAS